MKQKSKCVCLELTTTHALAIRFLDVFDPIFAQCSSAIDLLVDKLGYDIFDVSNYISDFQSFVRVVAASNDSPLSVPTSGLISQIAKSSDAPSTELMTFG